MPPIEPEFLLYEFPIQYRVVYVFLIAIRFHRFHLSEASKIRNPAKINTRSQQSVSEAINSAIKNLNF